VIQRITFKISILLWILGYSLVSKAQYTKVGEGAFTSLIVAPMYSSNNAPQYNRCAYLYPASTLGRLQNGDSVKSLSFLVANSDPMRGAPKFKIYLANSIFADLGPAAANWNQLVQQSVLVYDDNPAHLISGTAGYIRFPFNQTNGFVFDTTGGAYHLQVLVEYEQTDSQSSTIFWYAENGFSVSGFQSNNETKYISGIDLNNKDSLLSGSSILKPTLRIEFPSLSNETEFVQIHALGSIATLMDRGDSVKARFLNIGKEVLYNKKVYLNVTGSNTYQDSLIVDSLVPFVEKLIRFPEFKSRQLGTETIAVLIEDDDNNANNSGQINRIVDYNKASHTNPLLTNNGGVGIGGGTGDFVAKFYTEGVKFINQITVQFTTRNLPFQLGIWAEDSNGLPGTLIFLSDTLRTTPGEYILNLDSQVTVNTAFFAGVRQASNANVGFGFQFEVPVRPDVFYFTVPSGDTEWTPFSPGYNFNFAITPRFQAADDIAVTDIHTPMDNDSIQFFFNRKIPISATVKNVGFNDQLDSFPVVAKIFNLFGMEVYRQTQRIALLADSSIRIDFDSFELSNLGRFRLEITSTLSKDSITDNNTITHIFHTFLANDLSVPFSYVPFDGQNFVRNDSLYANVNVSNNGINRQVNAPVFFHIIKDGDTLITQSKLVTVNGNNSFILSFDPVPLNFDGEATFLCYSKLQNDDIPRNDTMRMMITVIKTNDLSPLFFRSPVAERTYPYNFGFDPLARVKNDGMEDVDSAIFYFYIQNSQLDTIYADSASMLVRTRSNTDVNFKRFNTGMKTDSLILTLIATSEGDQDNSNDTLKTYILVAPQFDPAIADIMWSPLLDSLDIDQNIKPAVTLFNFGFDTVVNAKLTIELLDQEGVLVLSEVVNNINIPNKESRVIQVLDSFKLPRGWYYLEATLSHPIDNNTDNNFVKDSFYVDTLFEYGIVSVINPLKSDTLYTSELINPSIIVENRGVSARINPFLATCAVVANNDTIYFDTKSVNVRGGQTINVDFQGFSTKNISSEGSVIFELKVIDKIIEDKTVRWETYLKDTSEIIGISRLQKGQSTLYPNPSHGTVTVSSNDPMTYISVYSLDGKKVAIFDLSKTQNLQFLMDLKVDKGVYLVEVSNLQGRHTHRWIVY
jgi:hypothetical protein